MNIIPERKISCPEQNHFVLDKFDVAQDKNQVVEI